MLINRGKPERPSLLDLRNLRNPNNFVYLKTMEQEQELGATLLADLGSLLDSDPDIDELGFLLPAQLRELHSLSDTMVISFTSTEEGEEEDQTKNESVPDATSTGSAGNWSSFWLGEHKLAISVTALPPLYKAAQAAFSAARKEEERRKNDGNVLPDIEASLLKATRALVIVNSDLSTAWNARKRIISRSNLPGLLLTDLQLCSLVLSYAPKSEDTWVHRRWIVRRMLSSSCDQTYGVIERESKFVEGVVQRSLMNYRAWRHRCWLVSYMTLPQVELELGRTKAWATCNCLDNCLFHYRRCMLEYLTSGQSHLQVSWSTLAFIWKEELEWTTELFKGFRHEALWIHRRFLAKKIFHFFRAELELDTDIRSFVSKELLFVRSFHADLTEDSQEHSHSYILWLLFTLRRECGHDDACAQVERMLQEECSSMASNKVSHREQLWRGILESSLL